ncbi:GGDEF domain-containing protein [Pseudoalteromonas fenneropenaei]|uniref:diguanylate cyclase n=1 Tax=Pseudoalteromonas fenneropenaei TaxID=1737459 RepID=A0ABV7CJI0_9GAMM
MQTFSLFKLHRSLWLGLGVLLILTCSLATLFGKPKQTHEITWLDAIGEGGICLMVLIWLATTLCARPKGAVTNWMFFGLSALLVSTLLDFFDEFVRFADDSAWFSNIEAYPAVVGMILMSVAARLWYQEQTLLNQTLMKKERFYRSHSHLDYITGLYNADYMKAQLQRELYIQREHGSGFCVGLFDIKQFAHFTREFGLVKANRLLRDVGQLISLNLPDGDLVCRYAGDKFIVLFSHGSLPTAQAAAKRIAEMINHHPVYNEQRECCHISAVDWHCLTPEHDDTLDTLMARLHDHCRQQKALVA